jgi:hypothetical protein
MGAKVSRLGQGQGASTSGVCNHWRSKGQEMVGTWQQLSSMEQNSHEFSYKLQCMMPSHLSRLLGHCGMDGSSFRSQ